MNDIPHLTSISAYADWYADRTPDAPALVLDDVVISYRELSDRVDGLARGLIAAGVRKGDRVAMLQTPHPDFVLLFLAAASIGALWVGLNPRYQINELLHVVDDAAPSVIFARTHIGTRSYLGEIEALAASRAKPSIVALDSIGSPWISLDEFLSLGSRTGDDELAARRREQDERDPCLIVYTSGSTGRPKGAVLHHRGIISFSRTQNQIWPVEPHRTLNFLPINHVGCVVDITTPCLVAGGTIFFMEQFDPDAGLAMIEEARLTIWGSVPSVFALQLASPRYSQTDFSSVQLIVWEGAAMPGELLDRLHLLGIPMATNYGLTETTSAVTVAEPTYDRDLLAETVGRAFPGVEIRLVDAQDRPVADGEPGQILTRSILNFCGYWQNDAATDAAFTADGFFRTGDLAIRDDQGFFRIIGRLSEMYKSGGYNVYPREVENALEEHPAVAVAAVVSRPDPLWQEVGIAFVQPHSPLDHPDAEELFAWCRSRLANYKVPKAILIEPALPLLPIGKIDKRALARRAQQAES